MPRFLLVFQRLSPTKTLFKASAMSKRKENSPQARLSWDLPLSTALQPQIPRNGFRNVGPNSLSPITLEPPTIPKHLWQLGRSFQGGFPRGLGPTHPCPSTVHMGTDSAPVFCVPHRIIATTTKICTGCTIHVDLRLALLLVPHAPPTQLWLGSTSFQLAHHR